MSGRSVVDTLQAAYAVAGGPLAWLAQINIVYPLVATPCFPGPSRNLVFPPSAHWAFVLAVVVYFVLLAAAVLSGLVAFRLYNRLPASGDSTGNHFEGGGAVACASSLSAGSCSVPGSAALSCSTAWLW